MMETNELYEFDLNGYIIYRNFLSQEDVAHINTILEEVKGAQGNGKFSFLGLDQCFMELMAHPRVLGILRVMLGDWLRFDHGFGIIHTKTFPVIENLHAGPLQNQRSFWYQWTLGQMHNGLINVVYALNDVNPGDGGFICVPGSHKANVDYRLRHDSHLVVNPTMKAGDVLFFTEALVHGSRQWTSDCTRRILIYQYSPGCVAWKNSDSMKPYLASATNDLQRDLLRPPSVSDYDEHDAKVTGVWPSDRRSPIKLPRPEPVFITQARDTLEQARDTLGQVKKSVRRVGSKLRR